MEKPRIALVLGGANTLQADIEAAYNLCTPSVIVGCNHGAMLHPGPVDHWATIHVELFPMWIRKRREKGLPDAGQLWGADDRKFPPDLDIKGAPNWHGSSGLLAVTVALLVAEKVICAGLPLDAAAEHFDYRGRWKDASNYRPAWIKHLPEMRGKVKTFNGWTAQQLGVPTKEWIDGN